MWYLLKSHSDRTLSTQKKNFWSYYSIYFLYLSKNKDVDNKDTLIKYYLNEHLSSANLEKACDIFDVVKNYSDDYISKTVKYLANKEFSDEKIIGGECSTPGIASLVALNNDLELRKKIDLNKDSKVLLFGCEGDADEELYQKLLAE